jgi:hypothetical protein
MEYQIIDVVKRGSNRFSDPLKRVKELQPEVCLNNIITKYVTTDN